MSQWVDTNGVYSPAGLEFSPESLEQLGTDADIIELIKTMPGGGFGAAPSLEVEGPTEKPMPAFSNKRQGNHYSVKNDGFNPIPANSDSDHFDNYEDSDFNFQDGLWGNLQKIKEKTELFNQHRKESLDKPIKDTDEYTSLLTPSERIGARIGTNFIRNSVDLAVQKPFQVMEAFNKINDKDLSKRITEGMKQRGIKNKEDAAKYLANPLMGDEYDPYYQAEKSFRDQLNFVKDYESIDDAGTIYKQLTSSRQQGNREGSLGWIHKKITNEQGQIDAGPQVLKILNKVMSEIDVPLPSLYPMAPTPKRDSSSIDIFSKEFSNSLAVDHNKKPSLVEDFVKDKFGIEIKGQVRPEGYVMPLLDFGTDLAMFGAAGKLPVVGEIITGAKFQGAFEQMAARAGKSALKNGFIRNLAARLGIGKATKSVAINHLKTTGKIAGRGIVAGSANAVAGTPINYAYALDEEGNFDQTTFTQGMIADAVLGTALGSGLAGAEVAFSAFAHAKANKKFNPQSTPGYISQFRRIMNKAYDGVVEKFTNQKAQIGELKAETAKMAEQAAPPKKTLEEAPIDPNVKDVDEIARIQEEQRLMNQEDEAFLGQELDKEMRNIEDEKATESLLDQEINKEMKNIELEKQADIDTQTELEIAMKVEEEVMKAEAKSKKTSISKNDTPARTYRGTEKPKAFAREGMTSGKEVSLINKELTALKSNLNKENPHPAYIKQWDNRLARLEELGVDLKKDPLYGFDVKAKKAIPEIKAGKEIVANKTFKDPDLKILASQLKSKKPRSGNEVILKNFDGTVMDHIFESLYMNKLNSDSLKKNFDVQDGLGKNFYRHYTTKKGGRELDDIIEEALATGGEIGGDAIDYRNKLSELFKTYDKSPLDYFRGKNKAANLEQGLSPLLDYAAKLDSYRPKDASKAVGTKAIQDFISDSKVDAEIFSNFNEKTQPAKIIKAFEDRYSGKNIKDARDAGIAYEYRMEKVRELNELMDKDGVSNKSKADYEDRLIKEFDEMAKIPFEQKIQAEENARQENKTKSDSVSKEKIEVDIEEKIAEGDKAYRDEVVESDSKKGDYDCD